MKRGSIAQTTPTKATHCPNQQLQHEVILMSKRPPNICHFVGINESGGIRHEGAFIYQEYPKSDGFRINVSCLGGSCRLLHESTR
eukprot:1748955-Amphidinium_carterae.1